MQGRVGLIGVSAAVACALFAVPASAQLPPIFPPADPPGPSAPTDPSATVYSPPGSTTSFAGNPSGSGEVFDDRVFGPLRKDWSQAFGAGVYPPLVADGKVIVNSGLRSEDYGTLVTALAAGNGKVLWERRLETVYFNASMAYADGVVAVLDNDAELAGLDVESGKVLWSASLPVANGSGTGGEVVADAGVAYAFAGERVSAFSLATGSLLWSSDVPVDANEGGIVIDSARAFVSDDCGSAAAFSRASGAVAWYSEFDTGSTCHGSYPIVAEGRVFAGNGQVYDAVTGSRLLELPFTAVAARGDLAYLLQVGDGTEGFNAVSLSTAQRAWRASHDTDVKPLLVGPTVYSAEIEDFDPLTIHGGDAATGESLTRTKVPTLDYDSSSDPGIAVGAGHLVVASQSGITALSPALTPGPRGIDLLPPRAHDYLVGARFRWLAGVGAGLRGSRPQVELEADDAPSGGYRVVSRSRTYVDGVAVLPSTLRRNTTYRADTKAGGPSRTVKLYAYPSYDLEVKATSRKNGVFHLDVEGLDARTLRRQKAHAYFADASKGQLRRLGSAPLRPGRKGRGSAAIRFRLLDPSEVSRKDSVLACVDGLPEAGYGRRDSIAVRCGRPSIPFPKGARSPGGERPAVVPPLERSGISEGLGAAIAR